METRGPEKGGRRSQESKGESAALREDIDVSQIQKPWIEGNQTIRKPQYTIYLTAHEALIGTELDHVFSSGNGGVLQAQYTNPPF